LGFCCWHSRGKAIPVNSKGWRCLGSRSNPKRCVVCRKEMCTACRNRQTRPTRSASQLCAPVPQRRWRVGTNSVSLGAYLRTDYRALCRMQAAAKQSRERSHRIGNHQISITGKKPPLKAVPAIAPVVDGCAHVRAPYRNLPIVWKCTSRLNREEKSAFSPPWTIAAKLS
jgi:hypothetical protein